VIRQQMDETRSSLTDKLEVLEQQVLNTVQDANSTVGTVKDTVEAVKDTVQETVETVKETVQGTVDSVKETLQGTVQAVKETVQDTVATVKDAFNIERHMRRHPWPTLACAVVAGFASGRLLSWMTRPPRRRPSLSASGAPAPYQSIASAASAEYHGKAGMLTRIAEKYGGEIDKLKQLAVSTAASLIGEAVVKAAPPPLAARVKEIVNGFTTKLGAKPLDGPILNFNDRQGNTAERRAS